MSNSVCFFQNILGSTFFPVEIINCHIYNVKKRFPSEKSLSSTSGEPIKYNFLLVYQHTFVRVNKLLGSSFLSLLLLYPHILPFQILFVECARNVPSSRPVSKALTWLKIIFYKCNCTMFSELHSCSMQ